MTKKVISPAAINALKEALSNIYWYKKDLKSYLYHCLNEPELLNKLNWQDYKRNIVSNLIDYLAKNQAKYMESLLFLMGDIIKIRDFSHLERLDDGKDKVRKAAESVVALEKLYKPHESLVEEQKKIEQRRKDALDARRKKQAVHEKIEELKDIYFQLLISSNSQARGFELERLIRNLFALYDLDPKSSFRIQGEQIDGAFTFDNTDYLFEGKWQKELTGIQDLDAFSSKIARKLDNTLGLFLSITGFSSML